MEIKKIHQILVDGGVIAYPTESVFGLGCDPSNEQAIRKILEIKKRTLEMGLVLLAPNIEIVSGWVNMNNKPKPKNNRDKIWEVIEDLPNGPRNR